MYYQPKFQNRNISDAQLLQDLQTVAQKLQKTELTISEYQANGTYHFQTQARRFGNWNIALQKSGIQITKHYNISDTALFQNIENLWQLLNRQPRIQDLYPPQSRFSIRPYLRSFTTWSQALKAFQAYTLNENNHTTNSPRHHTELIISLRPQKLEFLAPQQHKTKRNIPWRLRHLIMKRDNFACKACGNSPAIHPGTTLHIDHIIPWQKGGETTPQNLQTLCQTCNIGKSNL